MRAYWQILRSSDRRGQSTGKIKPSELRMVAGAPASAGDLAHVWLLSHPGKKRDAGQSVRQQWEQGSRAHSDQGLAFWLQ